MQLSVVLMVKCKVYQFTVITKANLGYLWRNWLHVGKRESQEDESHDRTVVV